MSTDRQSPRERLLAGHGHDLSTFDLFTLFLDDERSACTLARLGLDWFRGRLAVEIVKELGEKAAGKVLAVRELRVRWLREAVDPRRPLRQTSHLGPYLDARYALLDQEVAGIVLLDGEGGIVGEELLFRGSRASIRVDMRVILEAVLRPRLNQFIFFHTHPSPNATPSRCDFDFHERLWSACNLTGIELAENLTVGVGGAYESLFQAQKSRWPESVVPPAGPTQGGQRFWWAAIAN